jgi:hypothetical protein
LAADALDPTAVDRIFRLKGRPTDNPLIVHLGSADQLPTVVATSTPLADALAARFWPGPLTMVLDAGDAVPEVTTGGLRTVAVSDALNGIGLLAGLSDMSTEPGRRLQAHADALRAILTEGKRLRGSLTCLVAEALGGTLEQALPAALAVEMVQAASLVHDDFVDGDIVRRGRPAAWTLLSSRRAVLVADVIFATAIEKMAQAGAREGAALARAIAAMAQGALQEGAANTYTEDLDAYRRIIYLKTGSLFAAAARLGALAVDAQQTHLQAATEFGARAGEVYQIADDLADGAELGSLNPQSEIALLSAQARRALAAFPRNDYTRMLADMPEELLRMAVRAPTTPTAAQKRSPTRTR